MSGSSESVGVGIRVLAAGCWGFAATDDLTPRRHRSRRRAGPRHRPLRRRRAQEARSRAGARSRSTRPPGSRPSASIPSPSRWTATWPRSWPWTRNCAATPGITLAETSMHLRTPPPGVRFHPRQPDRSDPLPSAAPVSRRSATRMAKSRSAPIPNSFGGQYQLKGYELVDELRPAGQRPAHRRRGRGAALRRPVPRRRVRPDPRQLAARLADPRIHRPSHRARPRAGQRSQLRRHELPHARPAWAACATARKSSTWSATRASSTVPAWAPSPSTTKACRRNPPTSSATAGSPAT